MSETKSKFNPNVNYQWSPEDTFTLSGQEFAFMYNFLLAKRNEINQQFMIFENKLIQAVENGIAKEVIPNENTSQEEAPK